MKNILLPAGIILAIGLTVLSSISMHLFWAQLAWAVIGAGFVALFIKVDWRSLFNYPWVTWGIYAVVAGLLLIVYLAGPVIRNTRSWIAIGPLVFQPVEFAKIALILVYARYFSRRHLAVARWGNILTSFALFALPAFLTLLQPDLGSTSVLFGVWFGFLLVSGLPRRRVILAAAVFAAIGVLAWNYGLKDYQRNRIRGVLYPEENSLTVNYSVIQSKIAIGSSGFWGKGYGQGSQTQLGFLTEPANDFILAALVEEWGLAGGLFVIGAFLFLVWGILKVGLRAQTNIEKFIVLGTVMVFGLHFLINTGSAVGLFPVVGVPFPFLSQGGSNLLTSSFLLAIITSIAYRA